MEPDVTPPASPSTSQSSPSQPAPSGSRTGIIGHLTSLASALAALSFAGPVAKDPNAPHWMQYSAWAIIALCVLPPGVSLAVVSNAANVISSFTKRGQ